MQQLATLEAAIDRRLEPRPNLTNLVLVTGDVLAMSAAWGAMWVVAHLLQMPVESSVVLSALWPLAFVLLGVFLLADIYPGAGVSPVDEVRLVFTVIFGLAATVAVAYYLSGQRDHSLWWTLAVGTVIAAFCLATTRVLIRHLLAHQSWWGVPVTIFGAGMTAALVIERLKKQPLLNLKPIACFDDDDKKIGTSVGGVPVEGSIREALGDPGARLSNYAIVAMPGLQVDKAANLVARLGRSFAKVVLIPNSFGMSSVGVGTRDSGGLVGFYFRGHLSLRRNLVLKRAIDLLLLVPVGLLALPVLALSVLSIFVISPGNPFYAQEREGFRGRRIRVWKLRTMLPRSDDVLREHLATNPAARLEWETRFKLEHDPRVIPLIGRLYRRLSVDELPQLFNIAKGELSFVGPRPFPYYHLERFDPEFRSLRASVVPGLTGYWQVTSRSATDLQGQADLDTYYIVNWSLWIDLYVLLRTPWAVLFGVGAY